MKSQTTFYWVDTREQAAADAAFKGVVSWVWFGSKTEMDTKSPFDFEAVYLKTGVNELEREFARIMKENVPKC